jgi:glycine cleavage system H protein
MNTVRYTEDHEWVSVDDAGLGTVGITDYAQDQLGDLVFVELPEIGREVAQGDEAAVLESVKAAGEVKAPVGGTITEVNEALTEDPAVVNQDPEGDGWFLRLKLNDRAELEGLMDEEAYTALLQDLA